MKKRGLKGKKGGLEMVRRRKRGCSERLSFKVNKANKGRESDKERRVRRANENGGRRYSRHANSLPGR